MDMSMIEYKVDDANGAMEEGQRPVGNRPLETLYNYSMIGGRRATRHDDGTTPLRALMT
jgi:hypothetical protein